MVGPTHEQQQADAVADGRRAPADERLQTGAERRTQQQVGEHGGGATFADPGDSSGPVWVLGGANRHRAVGYGDALETRARR